MEEYVYTPASVIFKRTDDPSRNLKVALYGLVMATRMVNMKYIKVRPEMLNHLPSIFGIEYNSDGDFFFAGLEVYVFENLQNPFEFIGDADSKYPKKIVVHNDIHIGF